MASFPGAAAPGASRALARPRRRRPALLGLAGILPALVLIVGLILYPVGYAIWLSFFDKHSFFPQERWIGLGNYVRLVSDPEFWDSLWKGTVYAVGSTALQLVFGVAAALLLHRMFRGRTVVRALVLFPYMIPTIVAVILWKWLLNDSYGLVDYVLVATGATRIPPAWLGKDYIMWSLIVTSVWQFFPFVVVTYLARLQTIPPELYEAATVDGAGAWRRFLHVTLPQTGAVLFVIVLLRGIWMFTKFDTVWLMAGEGGVSQYVRTLPVYAYERTFTYLQAGMGATLAVLMFGLLAGATAVYFGLFREEEIVS